MSLDYTTLQSTVLSQAKRADKATQCPQYVRSCESMIRRKLQAIELRVTLDESDRVSEGIYTLPIQLQEVRAVFATLNGERIMLQNCGMNGLVAVAATDVPLVYAIIGGTIEFRGVPATDAEFEIVYAGWPDPLATTPTNTLLDRYEDLYVFGTLFFLFNDTQDRELAQDALSIFEDVVKHVNKMAQRRIGTPTPAPAYNFGARQTSRGY